MKKINKDIFEEWLELENEQFKSRMFVVNITQAIDYMANDSNEDKNFRMKEIERYHKAIREEQRKIKSRAQELLKLSKLI